MVAVFSILLSSNFFSAATPNGADSINVSSNETKGAVAGYKLNTSGGYITTFNISTTTQNTRWKAFVGQVTGSFTLDDSTGSTIYDWSLTSVAGEIFATRNSSTPSWTDIKCANTNLTEFENTQMSHTSADDNITKTFNDTTHAEFFVGAVNITLNTCPTLNTYINNATQDSDFEEILLTDSTNTTLEAGSIIYSTIMEQDTVGFDGGSYDFQMIVPENGASGYSGSTAYYLYVELN